MKGLLFNLLRSSNHVLKCRPRFEDVPLLLSSAYHQVEVGTIGKDSLIIKNFDRKNLDIWINGGKSLLKFPDEYRNRENGDIAIRLEEEKNQKEENMIKLIFCISARYEINISNVKFRRSVDNILGDKRRPSVMVIPAPYVKIIVDAV